MAGVTLLLTFDSDGPLVVNDSFNINHPLTHDSPPLVGQFDILASQPFFEGVDLTFIDERLAQVHILLDSNSYSLQVIKH
jgi:hypothetical protein